MLWSTFELIGIILWYLYQLAFTKEKKSLKKIYKDTNNRDEILKGFSNETVYTVIGLVFIVLVIGVMYLEYVIW